MASLTAQFSAVDKISDIIESISQAGMDMVEKLERAGDISSATFDSIESGASSVVSSVDGVAVSIADIADQTDHWTDAVGNYDRGVLEAIYSTEELVDMGLKTADALEEEGQMFEVCEQAADELARSIDAASEVQDELSAAMDEAAEMASKLAESEDVSAEAKEALAKASGYAAEAMNELTAAQEEAAAAMEAYDSAMASGTTDLDTLESAAERAASAAETLADANDKAANATEELAEATEQAAQEAEDSGKRGQEAAEQLAAALTSAGIAKIVDEIADAYLEASDAAAEFEVNAMKISTIADTTQVALSTISSDLLSLSMDTGESVNALAEASYSALSASVETASAVEFTATATQLATGGFTASATAVDVLTTALNAYRLEANQAESISDMLITTQNLGKTTVDELAASVGKVIPLASAYSMEMDNLSTAYAELTKGGIATAEAGTYLKSMLNELGDSGSTVSAVLLEETGNSFSELMEMGYSLGDVMDVLGTSVGGNAGAFNELWSSSEAGIGALSLYNAGAEQFNATLDAMQNSAGATSAAYATMTATTAHAQEEMSNAAANLNISIGQQINPLMDKLYEQGTKILNFMTEFTQEHPVVTSAISAIGIGLVVAATAMVAVTVATTTAIPAIVSFGTALNTALGPIGWVAIGITALTAAVAAFIAMNEENLGETEGMTAVTRAQYYELQNLNAEYEEACAKYGDTSEEALRLKNQVEDLSAAFDANRQTVEEFIAEVDALCESVAKISDSFDSALNEIHSQEVGTLALIQKYEDLATQANLTEAQEMQLEAVNQKLAQSYPELAEQVGGAALSADEYVDALKRACELEAEEAQQQQARETYIEALQKQAELTDEIAKAQENLNLEQERMDNMSGWTHFWTSGEWDDLNAYTDALAELQAAEAENNALIAEIEQGWADIAEAEEEAAESSITYEEAVATAYEEVREQIEELCAAYDEAYQAALESFEGQFGLFDMAEADMEATVASAQAALDSQLAYWESYSANLQTLQSFSYDQYGITQENYEALMAYVQTGTEEAAGLSASLVEAINSGDEEAIASLANTISEVSAKQEEIAAMTAEWQTDFSAQMDAIEQEMQETIANMDLSDEAAASAEATISSYSDHILAGKANAVAAAQEVANAVTAALSSANATINVRVNSSGSVEANARGTTSAANVFLAGEEGPELVARPAATYATGTTDSTDFFIAGENGPELIVGEQGSTVFPTQETDRLIAALNERQRPLQVMPESNSANSSYTSENTGELVKRVLLEIVGSGTIEITGGGGVDKETILEILMGNLKPALMNIIQGEIFEEGDLSYDY